MPTESQLGPFRATLRFIGGLPGWYREIIGLWAVFVLPIVWWEEICFLVLAFPILSLGTLALLAHWFVWYLVLGEQPKTPEEYYAKNGDPSPPRRLAFHFLNPQDWVMLLVTIPILVGLSDLIDQAGDRAFQDLIRHTLPQPTLTGKGFIGWFVVLLLTMPLSGAALIILFGKLAPPVCREVRFAIAITPTDPEILFKRAQVSAIDQYGRRLGRPVQTGHTVHGISYIVRPLRTEDDGAAHHLSVSVEGCALKIDHDGPGGYSSNQEYGYKGGVVSVQLIVHSSSLWDKASIRLSGRARFAVASGVEEIERLSQISDANFQLLSAVAASR